MHPYDINIDFEPKNLNEYQLAKRNFKWYSFRFFKVLDKDKKQMVPFVFNEAQERWWTRLKADWDVIRWERSEYQEGIPVSKLLMTILKDRQQGVSTILELFILWIICVFVNIQAIIAAHDDKSTAKLYMIIRRAFANMPDEVVLLSGERVRVRPSTVQFNDEILQLDHSGDSRETSLIQFESGERKDKAARAGFYQIAHISEAAQPVFDGGQFRLALAPCLSVDALLFLESTANGVGGDFHDTYWLGKKNTRGKIDGWQSLFIPWHSIKKNRRPLYKGQVIQPKNDWERNLVKRHGIDAEQLNWARYTLENDTTNRPGLTKFQAFEQEHCSDDVSAFASSGDNYFTTDLLIQGIHWTANLQYTVKNYSWGGGRFYEDVNGPWEFIEHPELFHVKKFDKNEVFLLTADVAEGAANSDNSTAGVWIKNPWGADWLVGCYLWRLNEVDFADMLMELSDFFNQAKVAPERNNQGRGMIIYMRQKGFSRFYRETFKVEGKVNGATKREYGFWSGGKSKYGALSILENGLKDFFESEGQKGIAVPFNRVWMEYQTLVRKEGKVEAKEGSKDDLVAMSWIGATVLQSMSGNKKSRSYLGPKVEEKQSEMNFTHIHGFKAWKQRVDRITK